MRTAKQKAAWNAYMREYRRTHERNPVMEMWWAYQLNAKKRGHRFCLPRPLFIDLITDNCYYCGTAPAPVNGVDRVDNLRGYEEDNVVTACSVCNHAKGTMSRADFQAWGRRLGTHLHA